MRVITEGNRIPTLMPSIMRATLVVGLSYLASSLPAYALNFNPMSLIESDNKIWLVIWMQLFQLLSWLPILMCFVTARKDNGFLGFHEIVSGTRVVRLAGALEYQRPRNVPVTTPIAVEQPQSFAGFEARGELGHRPDKQSVVLLGRDTSLERDVWIVTNPSAQNAEQWDARKSVSRPCRMRVIAEKNVVSNNGPAPDRWVITEAIQGMPLVDYVQQTPNFDWRSFRPLLRELVYELAQAQADETLPERLDLQSVWVDQSGSAKLLDQPLLPINSSVDGSPRLTPFELLTSLIDIFIENQEVPAHVLTFRKELDILQAEPDPLRQVGERLGELADAPSAWRWDDRLGVLAVSCGIEFSTASSLVLITALLTAFILKMDWLPIALITFGCSSLAALILGGTLGGGPVFRLSGVLVRKNKTLEPASAIQCALRNWLAWLPLIAMGTCLAVVIQQQLELESQLQSQAQAEDVTVLVAFMLAILPMMLVVVFGGFYSIFRPSRGLADVISGTRLIRK
jgi:hypothetical protein